MNSKEFREMNDSERSLVTRLLEFPFPGSDAIAEQLSDALVKATDDDGGLDFLVEGTDIKANVHYSIPVEGEAEDLDGITIHVLLHVIDGIVRGVEVYKDDSSPVIKMPQPSELRLFSPP